MEEVVRKVHAFFAQCQAFINNEKEALGSCGEYHEKMRRRMRRRKIQQGYFKRVQMADLMEWKGVEHWSTVVVHTRGYSRPLVDSVNFCLFVVEYNLVKKDAKSPKNQHWTLEKLSERLVTEYLAIRATLCAKK